MKVSEIPFVKLTGVEEDEYGLFLNFKPELQNHI